MPGKRSSRKKIEQFFCPYCEKRLWRLGGSKHNLFLGSSSSQQSLQNPSTSSKALEKTACIDPNQWIEAFFCSEHSKLWMLVLRTTYDRLTAVLASNADWRQCSTGIPPIDVPNPSARKSSTRVSRRTDVQAAKAAK
jgi:hypothetical protein